MMKPYAKNYRNLAIAVIRQAIQDACDKRSVYSARSAKEWLLSKEGSDWIKMCGYVITKEQITAIVARNWDDVKTEAQDRVKEEDALFKTRRAVNK